MNLKREQIQKTFNNMLKRIQLESTRRKFLINQLDQVNLKINNHQKTLNQYC